MSEKPLSEICVEIMDERNEYARLFREATVKIKALQQELIDLKESSGVTHYMPIPPTPTKTYIGGQECEVKG